MRRKIINPYIREHSSDGIKCFGCSPQNPIGLQLTFYDTGEELETLWNPSWQYEGFLNVLHGGIQATLLDEIASWLVFTKCETTGVTKTMNVIYHNPVYVKNNEIRITASLIKQEERSALIKTCLYNSEGKLCTEADVEYFIFPLAVAKRKYFYPGVEAFYE